VAAILLEPVAGNMGLVLPEPGFLAGLRELADRHGALLIFDEVMSGFRVARGGAAARFGVTPDLVTLGKVIGGGLPVGAYAGRSDIMAWVAPEGPVYQAGTLSGNPLAMAAGIATLEELEQGGVFEGLEAYANGLVRGILGTAGELGVPMSGVACGGMFGLFFHSGPVRNFDDAKAADAQRHARWFHALMDRGVYTAPSAFEASFISTAHGAVELADTLMAAGRALAELG
jgi:glutamate-1-semialdehyde 2,1-aminomutase